MCINQVNKHGSTNNMMIKYRYRENDISMRANMWKWESLFPPGTFEEACWMMKIMTDD